MNRPVPGRVPAVQPAELRGTFEGVIRGGIAARDENGRVWQIAVPANARVRVTGTAAREFLQSNFAVEFQAELDSHGVAKYEVPELKLVSLTREKQPGLFPAPAEKRDGEQQENRPRGEKRKTADARDDAGTADSRGARGRGKAAGALAEGHYRVVGRLVVGRDGHLTVQTGQAVVAFELAEGATITVDCADLSIVSKGDELGVRGLRSPARPGVMQANEIRVKLVEELSGPKRKTAQKPEAKRPSTRDGKKKDKDAEGGLPQPPAGW